MKSYSDGSMFSDSHGRDSAVGRRSYRARLAQLCDDPALRSLLTIDPGLDAHDEDLEFSFEPELQHVLCGAINASEFAGNDLSGRN